MTDKCVHTEHCCFTHGCKYGDPLCHVERGLKPQSFPCEACDEDKLNPDKLRIKELEQQVIDLETTIESIKNGVPDYPNVTLKSIYES